MRRRFKAGAFVAGALAAAVLVVGAVSAGAESGPKCADLSEANVNYRLNTDGTYTLGVELLLAQDAPACKQITYTLTIGDVGSSSIVLSQKGNKQFTSTFSDTNNQVCISATTSANGGHVHDAAPDTGGCVVLQQGPAGGRVGFG